ncbi:pilus assembly protein PilX [Pseudoalteromonas sp. MMG010]|uniref:pilus assembly protein PilX n=1 Tax=Pseudoalteromonas sp. MMG010 TaxID=2822685 RepID=UPI001B39FD58|nr:pilus assembly protein PilX [Pseudoalteromonas sp. MMG010]MBQ4833186.1 pilus assembly protein PilX [Pseudoalteromonas sp. MMG010]
MENVSNLVSSKKQSGIVLLTALIMVIAVTSIAVTLMSNSSVDIKITNAAQERDVAENQLMGEVQRLIAEEASLGADSRFLYTNEDVPSDGMVLDADADMKSNMVNLNNGEQSLQCPRRFSYTAGVTCNMIEVTTTISYGSKNQHGLSVVTGVAQEMSSSSKGM